MKEARSIDIKVIEAKSNYKVRETILLEYRPKIRQIASDICKRPLNWDNDDELSISLIAFNEAIDTYDPDKGMGFINYARMIIHNRLVDFFRREAKFEHESLDVRNENQIENEFEIVQAGEEFRKSEATTDLKETMELFEKELSEYDISLNDLVKASPKHFDTRRTLVRAARALIDELSLLSRLTKNRRLPINELSLYTGISRRVIERGRKYIIAIALLLSNEDFSEIKNFIRIADIEGGCII